MEARVNENQFGAKVPTEYEAIKNITNEKRHNTQVARYDKPNLDERQKAADIFNEALDSGMDEQEALELVRLSTGIDGEWLKCVPDWAHRVKKPQKKKRPSYSKEFKEQVSKKYREFRNKGLGKLESMLETNKALNVEVSEKSFYRWAEEYCDRKAHTDTETREEAVAAFKEYRDNGLSVLDAYERVTRNLGINVSLQTIYTWMNRCAKNHGNAEPKAAKPKAAKEEAATAKKTDKPAYKCDCGHELDSEFAFCPYCGKKVESDKERALKWCMYAMERVTDDESALSALKQVYTYLQGVGA